MRKLGAGFGEGAFTVETITKVGYRMLVAGVDGTRRDKDEVASSWASFKVRGRLAGLVAGAGIAAATAAVWAFALPGGAARGATTIGVEPVLSSTNDREAQRFASDLTADLARLAGASSRVNVIDAGPARSRERPDLLVRISVERQSRRLDATARVVDADDGTVLWSRSFVDESGTPSRLREQVALDTAAVMRCGLEESTKTLDDPTIVRMFFAACDACQTNDWERGQSYARQIVAQRPDDAAGWALLAMTACWRWRRGLATLRMRRRCFAAPQDTRARRSRSIRTPAGPTRPWRKRTTFAIRDNSRFWKRGSRPIRSSRACNTPTA